MRMIARISPNDTVLSPPNKAAPKQHPAPCRGKGVHGAGPLDRFRATILQQGAP